MNKQNKENSSVVTKIQQAYWEAKRNFVNSLGQKDDDCLITNDLDLDTRIEFLEAADYNFNALLNVLLKYNKALTNLKVAEEALGTALMEYGIKDTTKAGKLMSISGKCLGRSAHKRALLKNQIMALYYEIETFQYKATVDVLQTVHKMEKRRSSYRSGLMWMKKESQNLDPDISKKLAKFKKVQEHIKNLKVRFDRAKLEVMQKIDLYLLSRCNLFSQTLVPYRKTFCKMSKNFANFTKYATQTAPFCLSYKFEILKELNEFSAISQVGMKYPLTLAQNSKIVSDNLNGLNSEINCELRSNLVGKNMNSGHRSRRTSSRSDVRKKVRFYDCVDSESSEKQPTSSSFSLLIDLDEENQNRFKPNGSTEDNKQVGKYSDDLLSLNMNTSCSENRFEEDKEKGDFQTELEKCVDFLDTLAEQPPQEKTNELHFWSLMTNFENLKNECPLLNESKSSMSSENSELLKTELTNNNLKSKSIFHLEDVLIEFDPFVIDQKKSFKENESKEDC
ncbi:Islet cell autoantigen 1 like protein [Argiope bruennichi]|uniref:Islet cell autoantigen 1 like protein n=1 Tax=Argiope bruennichi TaxID=94029 RepID=A0A8T0G3V3_ARGBR|nr:Islet cell autoantigen 1 like protein [Argiope bruennichi]